VCRTTQMSIEKGDTVRVSGLVARPELNGKVGTALEFDEDAGRWAVKLKSGESVRVKMFNLELAQDDDDVVLVPYKKPDGTTHMVDPGKLQKLFTKIVFKYDLNKGDKADKLADYLTDSTEGRTHVTPEQLGKEFGMSEEDANTFLAWIQIGVAFKEGYIDPHMQPGKIPVEMLPK